MQNLNLIEKIQNLPPETRHQVEDFVEFLSAKQKAKYERENLLQEYAAKHAGTDADFDVELETAGVEHLLETRDFQ